MTGARPYTVQHSLNRAHTVFTYRTALDEYGKRSAASFPGSSDALHLD